MEARERGAYTARPNNPLAARERLVAAIGEQIARCGYYRTDIAPTPAQLLVDLRWAAQMLSRDVGCHVRSYVSELGRNFPGRITVVVAPDAEGTGEDIERARQTRKVIDDLCSGCSGQAGGSRDVA